MRLIAFAFYNYEADGGLRDAIHNEFYDTDSGIKVFDSEEDIIKFLNDNEIHKDKIQIVDMDTLEIIANYFFAWKYLESEGGNCYYRIEKIKT